MSSPIPSPLRFRTSLFGVLAAALLIWGSGANSAHAVRPFTYPVYKQPKAPLEQGSDIKKLRKVQYLQKRGPSNELSRGGVKDYYRKHGWSWGTLKTKK